MSERASARVCVNDFFGITIASKIMHLSIHFTSRATLLCVMVSNRRAAEARNFFSFSALAHSGPTVTAFHWWRIIQPMRDHEIKYAKENIFLQTFQP